MHGYIMLCQHTSPFTVHEQLNIIVGYNSRSRLVFTFTQHELVNNN